MIRPWSMPLKSHTAEL